MKKGAFLLCFNVESLNSLDFSKFEITPIMDYYNLSDFTSITIENLIRSFQLKKTIKQGSISVFSDSIGKPGDNIYSLTSIQKNENESIVFEFNNDKIIVFDPIFIVSNEKMIGIRTARKIEWIIDDLHLIYDNREGVLKTSVMLGSHNFRVDENFDAFMLYSW